MNHVFVAVIVTVVLALFPTSCAWGQYTQQNRLSGFSANFRSTSSAILSRPTVSPYLALTDLTGSGNVDTSRNYFTQVRPNLEGQATQRQTQRALITLQNDVAAARSAAARQSQGQVRGTGHPTRFGSLLHYYPGLRR